MSTVKWKPVVFPVSKWVPMPMHPPVDTHIHTISTYMHFSTRKQKEVGGGLSVGDSTALWISRRGSSPSLWEGSKEQSLSGERIIGTLCVVLQMPHRCGLQLLAWCSHNCLQHCSRAEAVSWNFSPFPLRCSKIHRWIFVCFQWPETGKAPRKPVTAYRRLLCMTALGLCWFCVLFLLVAILRQSYSYISQVTGMSGPASDRIWPSEQCGLTHA